MTVLYTDDNSPRYEPVTIVKGSAWRDTFAITDAAGTPIPFATEGSWTAVAEIRNEYGAGGSVLVDFSSAGGADGTITLTDPAEPANPESTNCELFLGATASDTLTDTQDAQGRDLTTYVGQLRIWQTTDTEAKYTPLVFRITVIPEGVS